MVVALIAVTLAVAGPCAPVLAQSNPSSSEIIKSLTPSGNLSPDGTRGIRLVSPNTSGSAVAPTPPQAPAAGEASPSPAQAAAQPGSASRTHAAAQSASRSAPSVSLTVEFATNSATLTPHARQTLEQLGHALTSADLANYRFRIEGHTDTVGSPALNVALSQRRADAVAAFLEQNFAIPASRLQPIGRGEEGLAVPTPPQTPELRNRRVEVINIGA
jgi:outer membrane protein OmpA-like peptidoglycan-associated protein